MTTAEHKAKKALILRLFDAFDRQISEQTADIYALSLETVSIEAVECTLAEYCEGRVPGQNIKRCPSSAEFAARARLMNDALEVKRVRIEMEKDGVLPLPPPATYTVDRETRKKVSGLLLDLASRMKAKNDEAEAIENRRIFRADAETTGDPRPLAERLRLA